MKFMSTIMLLDLGTDTYRYHFTRLVCCFPHIQDKSETVNFHLHTRLYNIKLLFTLVESL